MSREDLHFRLRIPPELKDRVQEAADRNKRSMTAEIIHRLETTFEMDDYAPEQNAHPDPLYGLGAVRDGDRVPLTEGQRTVIEEFYRFILGRESGHGAD